MVRAPMGYNYQYYGKGSQRVKPFYVFQLKCFRANFAFIYLLLNPFRHLYTPYAEYFTINRPKFVFNEYFSFCRIFNSQQCR